uniref:Uncharacterized protein TCIL3000_11_7770 n=1 Tax=Trypanosoma congolense (strain IL3000) TaxID=1068625 RepID=G0V117_TRYCI|nr:unnamed protein product [Trypanosoma congolense IL3000]
MLFFLCIYFIVILTWPRICPKYIHIYLFIFKLDSITPLLHLYDLHPHKIAADLVIRFEALFSHSPLKKRGFQLMTDGGSVDLFSSLQEEITMARQKIATLEDIIRALDADLHQEREKYSAFQAKVAKWKEQVKKTTINDRARIAELEEELSKLKLLLNNGAHKSEEEKPGSSSDKTNISTQQQQGLTDVGSAQVTDKDDYRNKINNIVRKKDNLSGEGEFEFHKQDIYMERIAELQQKTEDNMVRMQEIKENIGRQSPIAEVLYAKIEDMLTNYATLRVEIANELSLAKATNSQLKGQEKRPKELETSNAETEQLRKQLAELETSNVENEQLRKQLAELETSNVENEQLRKQLAELETANAETEQLRKQLAELETSNVENEQLRKQLAELETANAETEQLRKQLAELETANVENEQLRKKGRDAKVGERDCVDSFGGFVEGDVDAVSLDYVPDFVGDVSCSSCKDIIAQLRNALGVKESELRSLRERMSSWKAKVVATKVKDDATINDLKNSVDEARAALVGVCVAVMQLFSSGSELPVSDANSFAGSVVDGTDMLLQRIKFSYASLISSLSWWCEVDGECSLSCFLTCVGAKIRLLLEEHDTTVKELEDVRCEVCGIKSQLREMEAKCSSLVSRDVVAELESRNQQLDAKCELLRKELRRQREAFQREKSQQGFVMPSSHPGGTGEGYVTGGDAFERDMLSLAAQQSQRDTEIRQMRTHIDKLEKENAVLKRECEHNNSVIAQYTKDMEVFKAKERVQLSIEYVRNVVLQYLCCSSEEMRFKMIPAIATVLEFSAKEKMNVRSANPACPKFH